MNCTSCGQPIPDGSDVCPSCGTNVERGIGSKVSSIVDNALGPQGMAPVNAKVVQITNYIGILVILLILVIELVIFAFAVMHGLPLYLAAIFIGFTILLMGLFLYSNHRIRKINFSNPKEEYSSDLQKVYGKRGSVEIKGTTLFGDSAVKLDDGESVIASLTPIYRLQMEFTGASGVSVEKFTENTILLTSRRVMFITIPLPGQGLLIGGGSQDMWNDMLKRKTIREMASKALETLKGGSTLDHFPNDFYVSRDALEQFQYMKVVGPIKMAYAGAVGFRVLDSKKLRYNVVDLTGLDVFINELNGVKKHII